MKPAAHWPPEINYVTDENRCADVYKRQVSNASKEVEDAVLSLSESSEDMAHFISENKNSFKAAVSLINALVAIKKLFS